MKSNSRELLLYYNSESSSDRKTLAYAKSAIPYLKSYNHSKASCTTTNWKMILDALALHPKDLLNKAHPDYKSTIKGREFTNEGWLNVLSRNPQLIKAPIAIKGKNARLCLTPTDIFRL